MHSPNYVYGTVQPWWFVSTLVKELRYQLGAVACSQTAQHADTYDKTMKGSALYGHCAAVAFIIHDLFGGKYFSITVNGQSHWFNESLGWDIDITGDQFGFQEVQIVDPGTLYQDDDGNYYKYKRRERKPEELNDETKNRARLLRRRWMNKVLVTSR